MEQEDIHRIVQSSPKRSACFEKEKETVEFITPYLLHKFGFAGFIPKTAGGWIGFLPTPSGLVYVSWGDHLQENPQMFLREPGGEPITPRPETVGDLQDAILKMFDCESTLDPFWESIPESWRDGILHWVNLRRECREDLVRGVPYWSIFREHEKEFKRSV